MGKGDVHVSYVSFGAHRFPCQEGFGYFNCTFSRNHRTLFDTLSFISLGVSSYILCLYGLLDLFLLCFALEVEVFFSG